MREQEKLPQGTQHSITRTRPSFVAQPPYNSNAYYPEEISGALHKPKYHNVEERPNTYLQYKHGPVRALQPNQLSRIIKVGDYFLVSSLVIGARFMHEKYVLVFRVLREFPGLLAGPFLPFEGHLYQ
jgi:hypothetical protein